MVLVLFLVFLLWMEEKGRMVNSIESTMARARDLAEAEFRAAGLPLEGLVINVYLLDGDQEWAFGSKVPENVSDLLAASLRQSAEEIEETGASLRTDISR